MPKIHFDTGSGIAGSGQIGGGMIGVGGAAIRSAHGGRKPKQPRFPQVVVKRPPKARKPKQPRFVRAAVSGPAKVRHPKTARMRTRHGMFRAPRWLSRPGGRSAVWRIGSARMSGLR
jgi:hypothetical protein